MSNFSNHFSRKAKPLFKSPTSSPITLLKNTHFPIISPKSDFKTMFISKIKNLDELYTTNDTLTGIK